MESFKDDFITEQLKHYGGYQLSDLAMLRSFVRPGDCVLDIGAHIGTFAVPLAQAVGPSGRLVAFEPVSAHAEVLRRNLEANSVASWASTRAIALGSGVPLFAHPDPENTGHSTVGLDGDGEEVQAMEWDTWWASEGCAPVHVVKIDVEGMEWAVLRGGRRLLEKCCPILQFEVTPRFGTPMQSINKFLVELGYRFFVNISHSVADDRFVLGEIRSVGLPGHIARQTGWDVLAVPRSSDRLSLGGLRGPAYTLVHCLAWGLHTVATEGRHSHATPT
jgi:FkbM family methyltransferase